MEKFDKYWHDMSGILFVACIFYPTFKIKLVEYYFAMIYGDDAISRVHIVNGDRQSIMKEYKVRYASAASSLEHSFGSLSASHSVPSSGCHRSSTEWISGFTSFLMLVMRK